MHCLQVSGTEPKILWERDLLHDFGAPNLRWGVSVSPLVGNHCASTTSVTASNPVNDPTWRTRA